MLQSFENLLEQCASAACYNIDTMSLTNSDLQRIEAIFDRKLAPVLGKLEALENDVKEIYRMITKL